MFSYVLNNRKWIEAEKIYPHDIALLLDHESKKIYIWNGPRSPDKKKEEGTKYLNILKKKFSEFEYVKLDINLTPEIQNEINLRLDTSFEEVKTADRSPPYTGFMMSCYISLALLGVAFIFILGPWFWLSTQNDELLFMVSEANFNSWTQMTSIVIIILIINFIIQLVFALLSRKIFLIMTASIGVAVELGAFFYISMGIYLFDIVIPQNPISGFYYYGIIDIILYTLLHIIGLLAILIPLKISFSAIMETTIPIPWKEWREKNKKVEFNMKNVSAFAKPTTFLPFDTESLSKFEMEKELETDTTNKEHSNE
ncbi:MAG: hypothetical protein GY870_19540 [archaeon]|nr:hypothetical protein [archaeon]